MFWRSRVYLLFAVAGFGLLGAVITSGCDSVEQGGEGHLRVLLTDAPFPYEHVAEARVTIDRVEIVPGVAKEEGDLEGAHESGGVLIASGTQSFNLLDLRDGVTALLGEVELEATRYSHIRMHVSNPLVVMEDGREYPLKVPSTVVRVLLPSFEVSSDGITELTLDFKLEHSFVTRGNVADANFKGFIFKPVVKALRYVVGGEETLIDDDGDADSSETFEIAGTVEELTDSSLTVEGLEIVVKEQTAFENVDGLSGISLSDVVRVFYRLEESGDLTADLVVLQ